MAARKPQPPPVRCTAKAKQTGARCRKWAVPGAAVCNVHGAYAGPEGRPAAEARLAARRTIAELISRDPRPLSVVLRDAVHLHDAVMTEYRTAVAEDGQVDAETIARMLEAARGAASLASSAVLTKALADERQVVEAHADQLAGLIDAIVDGLGLSQRPGGIRLGPLALVQQVIDAALARLQGKPADEPPVLVELVAAAIAQGLAAGEPHLAEPLRRWVLRVVEHVADARPGDVPPSPMTARARLAITAGPPPDEADESGLGDEAVRDVLAEAERAAAGVTPGGMAPEAAGSAGAAQRAAQARSASPFDPGNDDVYVIGPGGRRIRKPWMSAQARRGQGG